MSNLKQSLDSNQLDQLESEYPKESGVAFARAYQQAVQAGLSVVVSENGEIVEIFPDGQRRFIKSIASPITDKPGRKITIS